MPCSTASPKAGSHRDELDAVAFYDKPITKFDRILETYISVAPKGLQSFMMALPLWMRQKLWIPLEIENRPGKEPESPTCRRCSSPSTTNRTRPARSFPRPIQRAAILTVDGVGEWATSAIGARRWTTRSKSWANCASPIRSDCSIPPSPTSPGFKVNSGEYKLMGLAPYGEPRYVDAICEEPRRSQARTAPSG